MPRRSRRVLKCTTYTGFYGDKILYKNLDLTQDFPNKICFTFFRAVLMGTKSCTKISFFSAKILPSKISLRSLWGKNLVDGEMFLKKNQNAPRPSEHPPLVWAWFRQTGICSSMRGRYKIQSAEWKWQRIFS